MAIATTQTAEHTNGATVAHSPVHTRLIDCDIHHQSDKPDVLFPYLPRHYVEWIKDFGSMMPGVGYTNMPGSGARVESITPLAPEWETALESDLSRAIQRVTAKAVLSGGGKAGARGAVQAAPIDPAVSEQLLRLFPDLKTRSYDAMAQELRVAALEEFKTATTELQTKVSAAQQALAAAQANKGEAEQQEALKNFQQVQAEQAEKLKGITAWLQERLTALQQLKSASDLSSPAR